MTSHMMKRGLVASTAMLVTALAVAPSVLSAMPINKYTKFEQRPMYQSVDNVGVELFSGLYVHKDEEVSIGSGDNALSLVRYYAPLPARSDDSNLETYPFTGDWTHNLDFRALGTYNGEDDVNSETVQAGEGVINVLFNTKILTFEQSYNDRVNNTGRWYEKIPGTSLTVGANGDTMTVTALDGTVAELARLGHNCGGYYSVPFYCGYGMAITSPSGERLDYEWQVVSSTPEVRRLKSVRSNRGNAIVFEYANATDLQAAGACAVNLAKDYLAPLADCPSGARKATYSGLASAAKPGDVTSLYSGGTSGTGSFYSRQSIDGAENAIFDDKNRVVKLRFGVVNGVATGGERTYAYKPIGYDANTDPYGNYETTVTEADGGKTVYLYQHSIMQGKVVNVMPFIARKTDPLGKITEWTYDGYGHPLTEKRPEGDQSVYTYDGRGNRLTETLKAKPGTGLPDILLKTTAYPSTCTNAKTCNKPTSITDARGGVTDFTYDSTHGGILTETGPEVNNVRPQKRYEYEQRFGVTKNSSGALVANSTGVWVLKSVSECMVGSASGSGCSNPSDEVKTVYEYGTAGTIDALNVVGTVVDSGSGTLNLRTCVKYDAEGNRISETQPRAGLTTCN